jgi:DNA-3-methyladenine glycosylase I
MSEFESHINQEPIKQIFESIRSTIARFDTGNQLPKGYFDLDLVTKDWEHSDDDGLFENMAACIFAAGMKITVLQKRWTAMRSAFGDFRISHVASLKIDSLISNKNIIRHPKKLEALITNAHTLLRIQKDEGSFVEYLRRRIHKSYDFLLECVIRDFEYLGPATGRDFLKDIGMGGYKPDVHLMRILMRLGLWNGVESELTPTVQRISEITDLAPSEIDRLLFRLGSGHKLQHAICGTAPICDLCLVDSCASRGVGNRK